MNMNKTHPGIIFLFLIGLAFSVNSCHKDSPNGKELFPQPESYRLWYRQPAANWNEALPVGNGRLGGMVFGRVFNERIQLNEESLWAGQKLNTNNPDALKDLGKIRALIFAGDIKEAYKLGNKSLLGTPPRFRSYQTFCDLYLLSDSTAPYSGYRRELLLNRGISRTQFTVDGVTFIREIFASAPDNLIVVHLSADQQEAISTTITLKRAQDAVVKAENNQLTMTGQIIDKPDRERGPGGKHMRFAAKLLARNTGGRLRSDDSTIHIENADELTLMFTAATDYNLEKLNFDPAISPSAICDRILAKAEKKPFDELKTLHIREHTSLFNRVQLDLGDRQRDTLPTDERLKTVINGGEDPALVALYFQYGRYLLMGCSRAPGILPANLQGIWNDRYQAPWNSDYHTNINLQMNYWPAEACNLPETIDPLVEIVDKWRTPGRVTAKEMYGCNGWTMHHATDIFGKTTPNADMRWGMSPLSGVWMTFPLWRHYQFTLDTNYLRKRAYPVMKEAMAFVSDFLSEHDGYLVTNPSMSPENAYLLPGKDYPCRLTYAPTIDNEVLTAHIDHCMEAAKILGVDEEQQRQWKQIRMKIPPVRVGSDSTVMEWIHDYKEWEPGHRHMSHLLGLYPLAQITPETPELFEAAKKTIEKRLKYGGGHTGWSRAWIINFFARLQEPETAYRHVTALLRKSTQNNLFDSHPPFQIDGNFGGTAGIAEMLLQSYHGVIRLLPALPREWPEGKISGLKARGGFSVDMQWKNGTLVFAAIRPQYNGKCRVKYKDKEIEITTQKGKTYFLDQELKTYEN